MSITQVQLFRIKDLLVRPISDAELDVEVAKRWDNVAEKLCRRYDLFIGSVPIDPIVGEAIYSSPANSVRIFSVSYGKICGALGYTNRTNLNNTNRNWEKLPPGNPRYWLHNTVPPEVDSPPPTIGPKEFLIHPSPSGETVSRGDKITLVYNYCPVTFPLWLEPVLIYGTVAELAAEDTNCLLQPEKAQWFRTMFDLWVTQARRVLGV